MAVFDQIKKDFMDALEARQESGTSAYDTEAQVVRVEGSTAWVHIPGGVDETPVKMTIHSEPGDTVQVRVSGGSAWLVGNETAPPTDDTTAIEARLKSIEAEANAKKYADTAISTARAEIKVTTDGITSTVEKIGGFKYLVSAKAGTTWNGFLSYAQEGKSTVFTIESGALDCRVGDTVFLKYKDKTNNVYRYIRGTVNAEPTVDTKISLTAHGYEDILPVDTIKSTINQSADSVKIQAKHVDIEGAAIFSSGGRLNEASLDAAYDAKGAASAAETASKTYADGKASTAESNAKSYADSVAGTAESNAKAYADTAAGGANAREQLIYISKATGTTSVSANTTWVTNATGNQNVWTTKRPEYSKSYPVLFVATQRQTVSQSGGTDCTCTTPMIDDTTTVIDGGNIITGTVTANQIAANAVTAEKIDVNDLFAQNINATGSITGATIKGANGAFTRGFDVNILFDVASGDVVDDESETEGDTVLKYFHVDRDTVRMGYDTIDFFRHYRDPAHPASMTQLEMRALYIKLIASYIQLSKTPLDGSAQTYTYLMENVINAFPVILYDNDSASLSGVRTLSETAANFRKLTICFKSNDGSYGSVDVWNPNGKNVCLAITDMNDANPHIAYHKVKTVKINGTSIDTVKGNTYKTMQLQLGGTYTSTQVDNIGITQVIGYR